jgi:hypothetical protein
MGNTPNNNFPFPESTDLVKDGAQAIEDLADAIDTTLGVYAPPATGLTLINTTSFSGVSSVSLPASTFTSTYRNYKILIDNLEVTTSNQDMFFRMRTTGSDYTVADYHYQFSRLDGSSNSVSRSTSQTAGLIGSVGTTNKGSIVIDIFNPNVAVQTTLQSFNPCNISVIRFDISANMVTGTNQFDALSFYPGANNISGNYAVYGYNI